MMSYDYDFSDFEVGDEIAKAAAQPIRDLLRDAFKAFKAEGCWYPGLGNALDWVPDTFEGEFWKDEFPVHLSLTPDDFVTAVAANRFDMGFDVDEEEGIPEFFAAWRDALSRAESAVQAIRDNFAKAFHDAGDELCRLIEERGAAKLSDLRGNLKQHHPNVSPDEVIRALDASLK
jgi:hypothetical protein